MSRLPALRIRALRALERPPDATWVQWAVDELMSGEDGPSLRILAGLRAPLNYFETVPIVDAALRELGMERVSLEEALISYVVQGLVEAERAGRVSREFLREIGDIYVEAGFLDDLQPFYLLYNAWTDLDSSDVQWYWPGANSANIEKVVLTETRRWLAHRSAV